MKILFVSTSIPPYPDMQSIRNIFLVKGLEKRGHSIDIITAEFPWASDDLVNKLSEDTHVYYTGTAPFVKFSKYLQANKKLSIANRIFNVLVHYVAIPDMHMFWNLIAKKEIQTLLKQKQKYDLVITSSGSYTAHFVGHWLKKHKNIDWIAEYGDPWGLDSYGKIKTFNYKIEKRILKLCKGLIFTTQTTIDAYVKQLSDEKFYHLAPCGYDDFIHDYSQNARENNEDIIIGYIGVAYASSRNLMPAIESIIKTDGLKMKIVGSYSKKYKNTIDGLSNEKVRFMGRVSYDDSLMHISKMDALLHIGNKGTMQVPGKTYIYLSSEKPIVYIKQQVEGDPTYDVLKNFSGVLFCNNDIEEICNVLKELKDNFDYYKRKSKERLLDPRIKKYHWGNIGDNFADFIESTMSEKKG